MKEKLLYFQDKIELILDYANTLNKILDCYKFEKELRLKITSEILNYYKNIREENEELRKIDVKPNL